MAYKWIKIYLKDWSQVVEVSHLNKDDTLKTVQIIKIKEMGVPQKSILRPLLFLLYINYIPNATTHHTVLFVDVTIRNKYNNTVRGRQSILETIDSITSWLNKQLIFLRQVIFSLLNIKISSMFKNLLRKLL